MKCLLNFRYQLNLVTFLRIRVLMAVCLFIYYVYNALCRSLQESSKILSNTATFAVNTAVHSCSAKPGTCHQSYGKAWRGVLH